MLVDLFVKVVGCYVILDYEEHVSNSVTCRLNAKCNFERLHYGLCLQDKRRV